MDHTLPLIPRKLLFDNPERTQARLSPDGAFVSWLAPKAGVLNVNGRNAPVVLCKDPSPMVKGDTLQFGSMEKPTDGGNWRE